MKTLFPSTIEGWATFELSEKVNGTFLLSNASEVLTCFREMILTLSVLITLFQ